ncbi:MAG: formate dehydrogenase subunit gamma [Burkholderiales bacterium]|nr:formate dehydrogenase subunit gamma [Burkholderiales bacterium]
MHSLIRGVLAAAAVVVTALLIGAPAWAQDKAGPPAGFVAPAEPKPDESNAQRGKTQPGNNAPFWRAVRDPGTPTNSMPGAEPDPLIQPFVQYPGAKFSSAGEAWRQVRNDWIIPYGGSLFFLVALALGLFHWRRGGFGGHSADTGRKIERFTYFERAAHWSSAITFVILAVSGLVIAFGKFILLPLMGLTLFGWLSYALKTAHNFAGPLFAVSLVVLFVAFVRDNLPAKGDLTWLLKGGGMLSGKEVPSHRFNAGEKMLFWVGVFLLGAIVVGSGLVLDKLVPAIEYSRANMQVSHMIHAVASVLMMTLFLFHIYLGTIGMKGAYAAMRTGIVDDAWAKEHHAYWHDDIVAGKIARVRSQASDAGARPAAQV